MHIELPSRQPMMTGAVESHIGKMISRCYFPHLQQLSNRGLLGRIVLAATFTTRQPTDARGYVRSVGRVLRMANRRLPVDGLPSTELLPHSPGWAYGKVAVLGSSGKVACYQSSTCGTRFQLAACGNTLAAAAALYSDGQHNFRLSVELPDSTHRQVRVRIKLADTTIHVRQTWRDLRFSFDRHLLGKRRIVACRGPLNDYLLVEALSTKDFAGFDLPQALEIWEHFGQANLLTARLAVIHPRASSPPETKFFTCGSRNHPSAPLTGLAVMRAAEKCIDWLTIHVPIVETPSGEMSLPTIKSHEATADTLQADVAFPLVLVDLLCDSSPRASSPWSTYSVPTQS